jgi:succinate-semialdehyde dehydrogenase/glutarate-semialdehyde dehydrogenase
VVSVYRVGTEEEAIVRANATGYGLNSSVHGRDTRHCRAVAARLNTGTVNINEGYAAAHGSVGAPMGGMSQSGLGRRHGAEGILKYTEAQTVAVQRLLPIAPWFGASDEQWVSLLTVLLRAMKRLGLR